jgi:predicted dehydrogenase
LTEPLKTVLVGFGKVASMVGTDPKAATFLKYPTHASVLREHPAFSWDAVIDPDESALVRAREDWGVRYTAKTFDELSEHYRPDVAIIATPENIRLEIIENMQGIKGILFEKPLARNLEEASRVVSWCVANRVVASVNLFRRAEKFSASLSRGKLFEHIGNPQTAHVLYGNGLRNNGIHMVDLVRMLLGEVDNVQAFPSVGSAPFDADGRQNLAGLLTLKNRCPVYLSPINFECYRDVLIDIWGEVGRLEIYQEGLFARLSSKVPHRAISGVSEVALDQGTIFRTDCGTAYYDIYSNLSDVVLGRSSELACSVEEALKTQCVVEAMFKSNETGGVAVNPENMM